MFVLVVLVIDLVCNAVVVVVVVVAETVAMAIAAAAVDRRRAAEHPLEVKTPTGPTRSISPVPGAGSGAGFWIGLSPKPDMNGVQMARAFGPRHLGFCLVRLR